MSEGAGGVISDIIKDLRGAWSSRVSNPLIGAFALSWIGVNYRAVIVVLSGSSFQEKFKYLDSVLYPDYVIIGLKCLIAPFLLAIFYIYLLPIPTEGVYRWTLNRQRRLNRIAREVAGEQLLSVEQTRDILEKVKAAEGAAAASAREAELAKEQYLRDGSIRDAERESERQQVKFLHDQAINQKAEELRAASSRASDLGWKLIYERAMAVEFAERGAKDVRLRQFITAREFEAVAGSAPLGPVRFHASGSLAHSGLGKLKDWKEWTLNDDQRLLILDESGRQVAEFSWIPARRLWVGWIDSASGTLAITQPTE